MDKGQRLYAAFALLLLLWLGWRQAHASGGTLPRRRGQATAQAVLSQHALETPPSWNQGERPEAEFQAALAAQSSQLLLSAADFPRFLDERAAQQAALSAAPFGEKLNTLEVTAATTFVRMVDGLEPEDDGGGGGGVVVVGTSARGRTYPSSRSSSSSFSHK